MRRVLGSGHDCVEVMVTGVKCVGESRPFFLVDAARERSGQRKYEATMAPLPRPTRRAVDPAVDLGAGDFSADRYAEERWLGSRERRGRQRAG